MIKVNARLNSNSAWAQAVTEAMKPEVHKIAVELGRAAEQQVKAITSSEYGHSGTSGMALSDSFEAQVGGAQSFPIYVTLRTKGGANLDKVNALNSGRRAFTLSKAGGKLSFPGTNQFAGKQVFTKESHPGAIPAGNFMRRAVDAAIKQISGIRRR